MEETISYHNSTISPKKLCKLLKKKDLRAVVVLNNNKSDSGVSKQSSSIPLEIDNLLQEFVDVFREPSDFTTKKKY